MKKLFAIIVMAAASSWGADTNGTIQQKIVPTSQFSREAFTNETAAGWRAKLGAGTGSGDGTGQTNWDFTAITNAPWQIGNANLTNWGNITTNLLGQKQFGSANLTNWSAITTNILGEKQYGSLNLTNWSGIGTNVLTNYIRIGDLTISSNIIWERQASYAEKRSWDWTASDLFETNILVTYTAPATNTMVRLDLADTWQRQDGGGTSADLNYFLYLRWTTATGKYGIINLLNGVAVPDDLGASFPDDYTSDATLLDSGYVISWQKSYLISMAAGSTLTVSNYFINSRNSAPEPTGTNTLHIELSKATSIAIFGGGVSQTNYYSATNDIDASLISGDLSVDSITATTMSVDALYGNGANITNIPYLGLSDAARLSVTNAALRAALNATNTLRAEALVGTISNARLPIENTRSHYTYNLEFATNGPPASPLWVSRMPVPPRFTGTWNDFNGYAIGVSTNWANTTNVNEDYMITKADWNSTNGYRDAGWRLEILEEGVFTNIDAGGNLVVDGAKFPNGLRYLTDYYHSKGLKLGIYTALGPNFGNLTCELGVATSYTNLDRHIDQFINTWGFDFIFIDECGGTSQTSTSSNAPTTTENMLLQRGRLVEAAIQKAGGNIGWLHVTRPTTGVRLDPMTLHGQNISIMGPINQTANWDFVEAQGPAAIVSRSYSNSIGNWKYTMPGHYWYQGQINDLGTMTAAERKFAFFMQTMLCGAITINSDRDFVESRGSFAFDASLGIGVNPPSTWSDATRDALFTNLPLAAIHQDPAVIPARRISSNHLAELWWRPVGWNAARRELSDSHAVMLINLSTTNQTQVVAFTNFAPNSGTFLVTDCLANTNFYATNFFTKTVEQTNCYIFRLDPIPASGTATVTNRYITYPWSSLEVINGTKLALSGNIYSLPWISSEGVRFAANVEMQYLIAPPPDATNATVIFAVGTTNNADANIWTNRITLSYFALGAQGNRVLQDPTSTATFTNLVISVTPGTNLTWFTNTATWAATNAPKLLQIFHNAATNTTGNRHIIGPTWIRYNHIQ